MIKAVLFDMDDTLLDINLPAFILRYQRGLCKILAGATGRPAASFVAPLVRAYFDFDDPSRTDTLVNAEKFGRAVERHADVNWFLPELQDALDFYDREVVPLMNDRLVAAKPKPGGVEVVESAVFSGLEVGLATNPTFTEPVIRARMRWGGLCGLPFKRVSHSGNSTRTKPDAAYYEEFVTACGWKPEECVMVGNDSRRDFPDPDCGMRTLYVGRIHPKRAFWRGSTQELAKALPRIVDEINALSQ